LKSLSDWLEKWIITIGDIISITHACLSRVPFEEVLNE
jgi:hypothetical protein